MKRWFLNLPRPARSVVGLSLMLALALFFSSLVGIFRLAYDSVQSANLSKPKISQLLGYEASVNQMAAELAIQRSILARKAYVDIESESSAGANVQQSLRSLAVDAGLVLRGSRLIDQSEDESTSGFKLLSLELKATGLPAAVDTFLKGVALHEPALSVRKLNLVPERSAANLRRRSGAATVSELLYLDLQITALMVPE